MGNIFTGCIYRHWIINDKGVKKSYIGQTIQNTDKRWSSGYRSIFKNAIDKYGWDNFHHDIIVSISDCSKDRLYKRLNELEIFYIDKYNSIAPNGYNCKTGGCNGNPYAGKTEEEMKDISIKKSLYMSNRVIKDETKYKLSKSKIGAKNPMYGIKGAKNPRYGVKFSDEHRKKLSESRMGRFKGLEHPTSKVSVVVYNGEHIIRNTITELSEYMHKTYGLSKSGIMSNWHTNKRGIPSIYNDVVEFVGYVDSQEYKDFCNTPIIDLK